MWLEIVIDVNFILLSMHIIYVWFYDIADTEKWCGYGLYAWFH